MLNKSKQEMSEDSLKFFPLYMINKESWARAILLAFQNFTRAYLFRLMWLPVRIVGVLTDEFQWALGKPNNERIETSDGPHEFPVAQAPALP